MMRGTVPQGLRRFGVGGLLVGLLLPVLLQAESEGEPVEYQMLARNTLEDTLVFAGLERFPDMALEPRLDAPGLESAERLVLDDPAAWKGFWSRVTGELGPLALGLAVDFEKHAVLVSAAGLRAGVGQATFIMDVVETDSEVRVVVEETPAECKGAGAAAHPLAAVRVARSSKPVRFDVTPLACPEEQ